MISISKFGTRTKTILIIAAFSIAVLILFGVGLFWFAGGKLLIEVEELLSPIISTPDKQTSTSTLISFAVDKHYFHDELSAVSEDGSKIILQASAIRREIDKNKYQQEARVIYFNLDDNKWIDESKELFTRTADIVPTTLIPQWLIRVDNSLVLKENAVITVKLYNGPQIKITTDIIKNEMIARSLPHYTKFVSESDGELSVDGKTIPVRITYSRIFSMNADLLPFVAIKNVKDTLRANLLFFWDDDGNFYFVDVSETGEKFSSLGYKSHSQGIRKNRTGETQTVFAARVSRDSLINPTFYTIHLGEPINQTISFVPKNMIASFDGEYDRWYFGSVEGVAEDKNQNSIRGHGLVEYIYNEAPLKAE